jgi:hypothetical protein
MRSLQLPLQLLLTHQPLRTSHAPCNQQTMPTASITCANEGRCAGQQATEEHAYASTVTAAAALRDCCCCCDNCGSSCTLLLNPVAAR